VTSDKVCDREDEEIEKLAHRLLAKAHEDFHSLHLNTLVAKMMEFVNELSPKSHYPKSALKILVQILSIYAPHLGEEMWQILGNTTSVVLSQLPEPDQRYLIDEMATYVIQVDGKVRGRLDLMKDLPQEEVTKLALEHPNVTRFVTAERVKKTIVVPNKLISFVTT
jgi:leucyl-tRNA synthetase